MLCQNKAIENVVLNLQPCCKTVESPERYGSFSKPRLDNPSMLLKVVYRVEDSLQLVSNIDLGRGDNRVQIT